MTDNLELPNMDGSFRSDAVFSPCGKYRYRLWRVWGDADRRCLFIGVNPSKAGAVDNDHTIRKEIGFAKRWGFGAYCWVIETRKRERKAAG